MASTVKIDSQIGRNTGGALNIGANTQKIRAKATFDQVRIFVAENFEQIGRSIERLELAARQAPSVSHISIDSADIQNLVVGGEDGPGQLTILSGPPSYTRIGFDGTEETSITATISTVNAATVTFTAAHPFEVDDIILIEGVTSINHLGYWVVATAPTPTTLTLEDPPSGSGTGGTATFQYAGGWRRTFAIGGSGFDTAPFFGNSRGEIFIGKNGSISLRDLENEEVGFIGVYTETSKIIDGATNATPVVISTTTDHGYKVGDPVLIAGVLGNTAANGYRIVKAIPTSKTFSITDKDGVDVAGNGAYTSAGTVSRYHPGIWSQVGAMGGTSFATAPFYADGRGRVRIGRNGFIDLVDADDNSKGFLGVATEASKNVTGAVDNGSGLIRLTITSHGWQTGDDVFVAGVGGVTAANGDWGITRIDANTVDLQGSTFGGAYTSGGTAYRYRGPFWGQSIAAGRTGYDDAPFRTFRDGSVRIGAAAGARMQFAASGALDIIDGSISIAAGGVTTTINAADRLKIAGTTDFTKITDMEVIISDIVDADRRSRVRQSGFDAQYDAGNAGGAKLFANPAGGQVQVFGPTGTMVIDLDGSDGSINGSSLSILNTTIVDVSRNGSLNSLVLTIDLAIADGGTGASTAAAARTNLDVYSKAEVDALIPDLTNYYTKSEVDTLLAGKANHGVFGLVMNAMANHNHGGTPASAGTPTGTVTI
jgi:hypothetical protein